METSVVMTPIKVNAIKLSEKTKTLTGASTIQELNQLKGNLFKDLNSKELFNLLVDLYNNKVKDNDTLLTKINAFSDDEKRKHAVEILTFQLELSQETPRLVDASEFNVVAHFMLDRINISNQVSRKMLWVNITYGKLLADKIEVGTDFSAYMLKQGIFAYINRVNSFTPETRDGRVMISPKRAGKGGNILLKGDKLIFQVSKLVGVPCATKEEYAKLYDQYQKVEVKNTADFKHDNVIDLEINPEIPEETKDRKTGFFNQEFQAWLNTYVAEKQGVQVAVNAA